MKTVADLVAELLKLDQTMKVALASDEEGNSFSLWRDIGYGRWDDNREWGDEFSSWTYDDPEDERTERALTIDECDTICLWP